MTSDQRLALVVAVASTAYLIGAFSITEPFGQYSTVGPRVFPIGIGIALLVCAAWIALTGSGPTSGGTRLDWRAAGASAGVFLAYLLLLQPVGYVPATIAFVTAESRVLGSRAWSRDLLTSVVVSIAAYGLFRLLLGVRLPVGPLG